jgi:thioredoxin 1
MAIELNSETFKENTSQNDKITMVDFWAPWCGPCKIIGPIVDELANEYGDKAIIAKLNVDENSDIAAQLGIRNIPTILFFKNGEILDKVVGMTTKSNLENKINSLI